MSGTVRRTVEGLPPADRYHAELRADGLIHILDLEQPDRGSVFTVRMNDGSTARQLLLDLNRIWRAGLRARAALAAGD